jgi:hypothetical protein
MKIIELPCYGIVLELDENGSGMLSSDLRGETDDTGLGEECHCRDLGWLALVDTVESMVLAHACAGIDVTTPAYIEGIETAVEAGANNL